MSDPLYDAELQMAEHECAVWGAFRKKVSARLGYPQRLLADPPQPATEAEFTAATRDVLAEDPEARELAERIGVFEHWRLPALQRLARQFREAPTDEPNGGGE